MTKAPVGALFSCPRREHPASSRLPTWAARSQASHTRPQASILLRVPVSAPTSEATFHLAVPSALKSSVPPDPTRKRLSLVIGLPQGPLQFLSHETLHTPCDDCPPATLTDPTQLNSAAGFPPQKPRSPRILASVLASHSGLSRDECIPGPGQSPQTTSVIRSHLPESPPSHLVGTSNSAHPRRTSFPARRHFPPYSRGKKPGESTFTPYLPPAKLPAQCGRHPNVRHPALTSPTSSLLPFDFPSPNASLR